MYQSDSFFSEIQLTAPPLEVHVINAFKILSDITYQHILGYDEIEFYPESTYSLLRCTAGEGKIYTEKKEFTIKEKQFIIFRIHDIKKYQSTTPLWEYQWTNFTSHNLENFISKDRIYEKDISGEEETVFLKFFNYGQQEEKDINMLDTIFALYFYTLIYYKKKDEKIKNNGTKIIDEICSYINQKVYSKISIKEISDFFSITPRRLHQIFTENLNISPKQYVLKKKMEEGYKLLVRTSIPVAEISTMLCFSSPYHFSNEFKKMFNLTPTQVRNGK